jgi:hypothetical protein
MTDTYNLPLTKDEAWAVLNALAEANRNTCDAETLDGQMRSWIADRLLKLLPPPAPPEPKPELIGQMTVGRFLDMVLPSMEGYGPDGELLDEGDR